jgi:hypothetical protein
MTAHWVLSTGRVFLQLSAAVCLSADVCLCLFVSRQAGRQADRRTDRQTHRQTDRQTDRQTNKQTDRQTNNIYIHTDKRKYRQAG